MKELESRSNPFIIIYQEIPGMERLSVIIHFSKSIKSRIEG